MGLAFSKSVARTAATVSGNERPLCESEDMCWPEAWTVRWRARSGSTGERAYRRGGSIATALLRIEPDEPRFRCSARFAGVSDAVEFMEPAAPPNDH
jgi:hypothetical protein